MRLLFPCLVIVIAAAPLGFAKEPPPPAPTTNAKSGGIDFAKSNDDLIVTADQGIELSQDSKEAIARVNAKAVHGNSTVQGDTLTAYYRPKGEDPNKPPPPKADKQDAEQGSSSEIWRVVADGSVEIYTPTQHAYGDHADYNIDDAVVVMTGDHLKMTTPQDVITARDTLEYWENKHQAVARGNAVAVQGEKRIQADLLVADFAENAQKQLVIHIAHGYDHVVLTTATDVVTGDRADYVVETGIVTVTGSVKMTRQNNQMDGERAVVNLNTGISTLYSTAPGSKKGTGQVRGLFVPQKKNSTQPAAPKAQ